MKTNRQFSIKSSTIHWKHLILGSKNFPFWGQTKFADDAERKAAFKNKWEELIFSNKLGYMATLRNLRNILEANVSPDAMQKVLQLSFG